MTILQVQIRNLGKLTDATVRVGGVSADPNVGGLTVLAGVNGTGKSFFSKFLYSVLDAVNGPLVARHVESMAAPLAADLEKLKSLEGAGISRATERLIDDVRGLGGMAKSIGVGNALIESGSPDFAHFVKWVDNSFADIEKMLRERNITEAELSGMRERIRALCGIPQKTSESIAEMTIGDAIVAGLRLNFQVPILADLKQREADAICGKLSGFGDFAIPDHVNPGVLNLRRAHPRALYLDSPAFWRVESGLKSARHERERMARNPFPDREVVDGTPKYFYDLADMLDKGELTGEVPFPEVAARIAKVIGGKVVREKFGRLLFYDKEQDRNFPLSSTAMGVANLGILAMLIERKLVDKRIFLFIDEPESNLHPAWQVEMVRALFALARGGVNVVMATHSVDIVKYLEVHAQEHPETKELVALNHFTPEGVVDGDKDFEEQLAGIMIELTKPFHDLRMREMRASRP